MDEQEVQELENESQPLTARQQAFVEHFVVLRNGTKAAIEAGYAPGSAHVEASRLLRNAKVRAAVDALSKERAIELGIDHTFVLERLKTVVERCLQVEEVVMFGEPTGEFKFNAKDANKALELLGKQLGMFKDQVEHTGPNGEAIPIEVVRRMAREVVEDGSTS